MQGMSIMAEASKGGMPSKGKSILTRGEEASTLRKRKSIET